MSAYYGKHFADLWGVTDIASVKRVWAEELGRLKPQQIALGMEACKRRKFPPTLPEFLELCKPTPEQLGIPPLPVAWSEARAMASGQKRREDCSHPVVWHAYYEAGPIGHMTERDARDTFKHCYEVAVDLAVKGEPLREIPKALPKPGNETRPPETPEQRKAAAEAAMAKLAEMGLKVRDIGRSTEASP